MDGNTQLRPLWQSTQDKMPGARANRDWNHLQQGSFLKAGDVLEDQACRRCSRLVVRPGNPKRILWEVLSLFVIAYDLITLPLAAFNFEATEVAPVLQLLGTIF